MSGKWIDMVIVVFVVMGLWRGFRRGLIREVFSLVGALLAVAVAYQGYQELSLYLTATYPMVEWLAQIIAFGVLTLAISLGAALFGYFWSRVIRLTPFAIIDNLAGAGLGVAKVAVITIVLVAVVSSLGLPPIEQVLADSSIAQQVILVLPLMSQRLESVWPQEWPKPGWLFPSPERWEGNPDIFVLTSPAEISGAYL